MAFLDYVPILSTIKHAVEHVPGESVDDYKVFLQRPEMQFLAQPEAAEHGVARSPRKPRKPGSLVKRGTFQADYSSKPLASDVAEAAFGMLLRQAIRNFLLKRGLSTAAATVVTFGVSGVLALDGALDVVIQIRKRIKIQKAAAEATRRFGGGQIP